MISPKSTIRSPRLMSTPTTTCLQHPPQVEAGISWVLAHGLALGLWYTPLFGAIEPSWRIASTMTGYSDRHGSDFIPACAGVFDFSNVPALPLGKRNPDEMRSAMNILSMMGGLYLFSIFYGRWEGFLTRSIAVLQQYVELQQRLRSVAERFLAPGWHYTMLRLGIHFVR